MMISRSLSLFEALNRENRSRNKERTCLKSQNVINESPELQRIYKAYYIQVGLYLGNRVGRGEYMVGMCFCTIQVRFYARIILCSNLNRFLTIRIILVHFSVGEGHTGLPGPVRRLPAPLHPSAARGFPARDHPLRQPGVAIHPAHAPAGCR